jgi:DNA-binding XRE family transcriptional regulator
MTRLPNTSYTARPTAEEIFTRHLNALCGQIRSIIYSGLIYTVTPPYACVSCACRILLRTNEQTYCVHCETVPCWDSATRARVTELLQSYPTIEECYPVMQETPPRPDIPPEHIAYGARVAVARESRKLTQKQLASQIRRKDGNGSITVQTIQAIERGTHHPSEHVNAQLEAILGLKEGITI